MPTSLVLPLEHDGPSTASDSPVSAPIELRLLGSFELRAFGELVPLSLSAQRTAAFVALQGRSVNRSYVAGCLWPDKPDARAAANLRSSLWRLSQPGLRVVENRGSTLRLAPDLVVDVVTWVQGARRLIADEGAASDQEIDIAIDARELLPGWYDDWVELERERVRQLRLHALEEACRKLTERGRIARAIDAGLAAIAAEPLRESSTLALIDAYIAEGNRSEAIRHFDWYSNLLHTELGVRPTRALLDRALARHSSGMPLGAYQPQI